MHWLSLIRWPNLLIIGLTQWVAWWCVVLPIQEPGMVLTPLHFTLLSLSTILIAAAGYIINDYFDIRIDAINKPGKVILERQIPRRLAIIMHTFLNVLALILAALVAFPAGHPEWLLLQIVCIAMLWRYSTTWKREFIIGNVVVALMTSLTIISVFIYEPVMHLYLNKSSFYHLEPGTGTAQPNPVIVLGIFSFFAFLLTWMREIVKDMEDYKGDDAEGCVTMPIQWGLLQSSRFVQALGLLSIGMLLFSMICLFLQNHQINGSALLLLIALILPLVLWIRMLPKAASSPHYHQASTRLKLIMVSGILSLLVLRLIQYA